MSGVVQVKHPLIRHHLVRLRDETTPPFEFRLLISRLAILLAYEATKSLEVEKTVVTTPLTETEGTG